MSIQTRIFYFIQCFGIDILSQRNANSFFTCACKENPDFNPKMSKIRRKREIDKIIGTEIDVGILSATKKQSIEQSSASMVGEIGESLKKEKPTYLKDPAESSNTDSDSDLDSGEEDSHEVSIRNE